MNIVKSQLARKLLIFIFSVSFILIIGSFIYFYISAKSYLLRSAEKEINLFHNYFEQSAIAQINELNAEINGAVVDVLLDYGNHSSQNELLTEFVQSIIGLGEEFYFYNKISKEADLIVPIKVFGGKQVLNQNSLSKDNFNDLLSSIVTIEEIDRTTSYCSIPKFGTNNYLLNKDLKTLTIIIKLSGVFLFDQLIQKIYFPHKINFSIVNAINIVEYSTNKYWINQNIENYLHFNNLASNVYLDEEKNIFFIEWDSKFFKNKLVITNDLSFEYDTFYSIISKVLFYSILIYLLISIAAIVYISRLSKSLNKISFVTKKIGDGDFNNKININRNDEVGDLIKSFNKMVDNLKDSYSKISETNKELELKITELSETKNELTKKQKLALIGETISKISHEIQNKISGVSVWIQNLEMQTSLDKNSAIYVNEIKRSLNSFVEMLHNFKKFYRKPYLEKKNFIFNQLVENIITRYENDIEAKKIKTNLFASENIEIEADNNMLEEAIVNLFVNAVYFSPKEGEIEIEIKIVTGKLVFRIKNYGPKIEEENLENIFNPFFTTKSSGSGLGLAICKNIIEAHNGKISVINLKPIGTRFEFILPLNEKHIK